MKNNFIASLLILLSLVSFHALYGELTTQNWFIITNYLVSKGDKNSAQDRQAVLESYRNTPTDEQSPQSTILVNLLAGSVKDFTGLDQVPPRYTQMNTRQICQETQELTQTFSNFLRDQHVATNITQECQ